MIQQYLTLMMNNVLCIFGDTVDSAFANNISLGVICVYAIIGQIKMLTRCLARYGEYYYRLKADRARAGLYMSFIIPGIVSIAVITLSKQIWHFMYIEEQYRDLLSACLIASFLGYPFESMECFVRNYCVYEHQEKKVIKWNIVFYSALVIMDAVIFFRYKSAVLLLAGTTLCYIVYAVCAIISSDILKHKYAKGDFVTILKEGSSYVYGCLLSQTSIVLINFVGTRLGTESYALLSVCRSVLSFGQECLHPIEPVLVTKFRHVGHKYKDMWKTSKSVIVVGVVTFFVMSTLPIFALHGDLPLAHTLITCVLVNIVSCVVYVTYIVSSAEILVTGYNKALRVINNYRLFTTLVLCGVALTTDSCVVLMLYSAVTDAVVSIVAYRMIKCKLQ